MGAIEKLDSSVGTTAPAISRRESHYLKTGVMKDTPARYNGKSVIVRELVDLTPLLVEAKTTMPSERSIGARAKQMALFLDEVSKTSDVNVLLSPDGETSRVDAMHTGILDGAVRLSGKDKRQHIETLYQYANERILIETYTISTAAGEITMLSDYRCIRALNEMYVNFLEEHFGAPLSSLAPDVLKEITGDYVFDIYDLCAAMGMKRDAEAARFVRKMLDRLVSTEFRITADNAEAFRKKFLKGAHEARIRYLTECSAYKDYEQVDPQLNMVDFNGRVYRIRFHSSVLENLLNLATRHSSNPGLLKERSGIAHRLTSWNQIMIGVTAGARDNKRSYLLDELWERMMVSSQLYNFERCFINLLKRCCVSRGGEWDEKGANISLVYGYYVEYNPCIEAARELMRMRGRRTQREQGGTRTKIYPVITISRDPEDPYVGDNSPHNLALRRLQEECEKEAASNDLLHAG